MAQSATTSELLPANRAGLTRAYLQLVRLPNVFTAMADILLGFFFTHQTLDQWPVLLLLLGASSCLYMAGMVLNDLFDFELDRQERPHRPLPSGRIHASRARTLGIGLLLVGVSLGWIADWLTENSRPGLITTALAALIVIYDASLRRTALAPVVMGGCRVLNVLLGMSIAPEPWHSVNFVIAGGIGLYIAGVTWFARNEAQMSHRVQLTLATIVILAGIGVLAWYPAFVTEELPAASQPAAGFELSRWRFLMLALAVVIGWRCLHATFLPSPANVQNVVKSCIISLIVLDAAVAITVRGWPGALPILLLLIPTLFLGRWIYST